MNKFFTFCALVLSLGFLMHNSDALADPQKKRKSPQSERALALQKARQAGIVSVLWGGGGHVGDTVKDCDVKDTVNLVCTINIGIAWDNTKKICDFSNLNKIVAIPNGYKAVVWKLNPSSEDTTVTFAFRYSRISPTFWGVKVLDTADWADPKNPIWWPDSKTAPDTVLWNQKVAASEDVMVSDKTSAYEIYVEYTIAGKTKDCADYDPIIINNG